MSHPALSFGRRALACILLAGMLAVALAACGSSSSSTKTAASTGAQFQARLNFAKCVRQHGINVPDPSSGGGPAGGGGFFRQLRNYPQAQRQAAIQACGSYLRQAFGNVTPAQTAQFRQQLVKYAECMRSHGIDIPDPTTTPNGGGRFGLGRALRSIDRNSPAFQAANTACGSLRPRFGRGGGGGGGAGPPGV